MWLPLFILPLLLLCLLAGLLDLVPILLMQIALGVFLLAVCIDLFRGCKRHKHASRDSRRR